MTTAYDYGPGAGLYPGFQPLIPVFSTNNTLMDAAGEQTWFVGHCWIVGRPASAKTISAAGGGSIGFLAGTLTFNNGASTFVVGIQDVDAANTPARGDGVSDVSATLTGGGGGLTQSVWNTIDMDTGTKDITHGQLIAINFTLSAHGGGDAIRVSTAVPYALFHHPQVTLEAPAATFTAQSAVPNVVITFDDGTLGTIYGSVVHEVASTADSFDVNSTPDEIGQIIRVPRPTPIDGVWGIVNYTDTGGTFEIILYSDPLGTPAAIETITVDTDVRVATGNRLDTFLFTTPRLLDANTDYAIAFRPTGTQNIGLIYTTVDTAGHLALMTGGTQCYYATRSGQSGAFSGTTTRRLHAGVITSGGDDAGGRASYHLGI